MIPENIEAIRSKIKSIRVKNGLNAEGVCIVAVGKTVDAAGIIEAVDCGITDVGESKVQEAEVKIGLITKNRPVWHMIGHLQTNKAKKAVELFDVIQSLDSIKLAAAINKYASLAGKQQECLVEVKVSDEESKFGVKPEDTESFIKKIADFRSIRITGLMSILPYFEDNEKTTPYFRHMKQLFDYISAGVRQENVNLTHLSMGMSGDYEVAVREGSNMVRIGTAIFSGGKR